MSIMFTLPEGLPWVAGAFVSSAWLLIGQAIVVSRYRKRAGIKYPQVYAERAEQEKSLDALKFNCAQRAHMNTLEVLPPIWIMTFITAAKYPHLAAGSLFAFVVGRIAYTRGYVTGDPAKRMGLVSRLSSFALFLVHGAATFVAGQAIYGILHKDHSQKWF